MSSLLSSSTSSLFAVNNKENMDQQQQQPPLPPSRINNTNGSKAAAGTTPTTSTSTTKKSPPRSHWTPTPPPQSLGLGTPRGDGGEGSVQVVRRRPLQASPSPSSNHNHSSSNRGRAVLRFGETAEFLFGITHQSDPEHRRLARSIADGSLADDPHAWRQVLQRASHLSTTNGTDLIRLHRRATLRFPLSDVDDGTRDDVLHIWLSFAAIHVQLGMIDEARRTWRYMEHQHLVPLGASYYVQVAEWEATYDVTAALEVLNKGLAVHAEPLHEIHTALDRLTGPSRRWTTTTTSSTTGPASTSSTTISSVATPRVEIETSSDRLSPHPKRTNPDSETSPKRQKTESGGFVVVVAPVTQDVVQQHPNDDDIKQNEATTSTYHSKTHTSATTTTGAITSSASAGASASARTAASVNLSLTPSSSLRTTTGIHNRPPFKPPPAAVASSSSRVRPTSRLLSSRLGPKGLSGRPKRVEPEHSIVEESESEPEHQPGETGDTRDATTTKEICTLGGPTSCASSTATDPSVLNKNDAVPPTKEMTKKEKKIKKLDLGYMWEWDPTARSGKTEEFNPSDPRTTNQEEPPPPSQPQPPASGKMEEATSSSGHATATATSHRSSSETTSNTNTTNSTTTTATASTAASTTCHRKSTTPSVHPHTNSNNNNNNNSKVPTHHDAGGSSSSKSQAGTTPQKDAALRSPCAEAAPASTPVVLEPQQRQQQHSQQQQRAPPVPHDDILARVNREFLPLVHENNIVQVNGSSYAKLGVIGKGGSCKVYRALSKKCAVVAIKKVKLEGMDKKAIEGYANEISLLKRLRGNPAIIQMYDAEVDLERKSIFVVMELGEADLNHILQQRALSGQSRSLNMNFIRLTWQQMLTAVHAIHEERIIHSDLKPANFLFVRGALKLIDFGIAKAIQSDDTTNIYRESHIGTLNYMSPEAILDTETGTNGPRMRIGRVSKSKHSSTPFCSDMDHFHQNRPQLNCVACRVTSLLAGLRRLVSWLHSV
jgi:serine/threonine-protein kinase TTK/MPS1